MADIIEIGQKELKELLKKPKTLLVDIREVEEFQDFNIGGINVPAHLLNEYLDILKEYETLIIACSNGTRSYILTRVFMKKLPDSVIYHLEEGIF